MRDLAREMRTTEAGAVIAAEDLCLEIHGVRRLDGVSLSFDGPGVSAVMGPNGAGKTLLLRCLHGLQTPTSGRVTLDGAPLTEPGRLRQAMVFQAPVLLRRSVAANVDFPLKARGVRDDRWRDACLARVGLLDRAKDSARRLSGGQQQRLALARALATRPEVLFLDEPTASLDPASALTIETAISEIAGEGVRVILVTHDVAQARRLASDVAFLARGRLVERGDAAEFFDAPQSGEAAAYLAGRYVL